MGQCMVLFYSCKHSPWSHKINLVEFLTLVCKWGLTISKPANIFCKLNTLLSSPNNFSPFRWWNVKGTPYFIAKWTGSKQRNVIKFTWGQEGIKPSYSHQFVICPKERKRKKCHCSSAGNLMAHLVKWVSCYPQLSLCILYALESTMCNTMYCDALGGARGCSWGLPVNMIPWGPFYTITELKSLKWLHPLSSEAFRATH